jgi:hypothetical protein
MMVHDYSTLFCGDEVTGNVLNSCATSREKEKYDDGGDTCTSHLNLVLR